ncbi:MarR family winged helix-turn-helix transcriptional regulator [Amycolatopsis australiensis]|uniref:DNA-binding transcriptional regulator, MarR family n=1 Tax=Amycolatopsis australiensis TaxID=546364 RepID=A0A1K1SNJ2_9PSEU|nr:MarR family transcriptional regulator [Amycolatopsis australiensis]SFW85881.1 DNA-binding transcriptional regulator, MarR family [Amycolatopsis australiensis]
MWQADDGTDAALSVLRAMVTIADSTVGRNTEQLTLTQFRALRVVADRTPVTMGKVARELALNPSSVTRACDRLVGLNLLEKAPNPLNRRETLLAPTAAGRQLVERVDHDRRAVLAAVLAQLAPAARDAAIAAFERFAGAVKAYEADSGALLRDAN